MPRRPEMLPLLLAVPFVMSCAPAQVKEEKLKPRPVANRTADDANPLLR